MRYIKKYENKDNFDKFEVGDIVVCIRDFNDDEDYVLPPIYGNKYEVIGKFKQGTNIFINVKDIKTYRYHSTWNEMLFITEIEWDAKKYNI